MSDIVTVAGSPSYPSRSTSILELIQNYFETRYFSAEAISLRNLPAEALLLARVDNPELQDALRAIDTARIVVIATPVYKAAYTGLLKTFLDVLPQSALAEKIIFPVATGGSSAHLLAIDYALKPFLSALGAEHILNGLYIQDSQLQYGDGLKLDSAIEQRLYKALDTITALLTRTELSPAGK